MSNKPIKTERSGCLMLFGLPFFLGGLAAFIWIIYPIIVDGGRMQDWPSVKGQLLHAKHVYRRSGDSTRNYAEARYRYTVNGQVYENDRVSLIDGSDTVGDFQEKLGRQLEWQYRNNKLVPIYYDPANPADSILNRDIRWEMIGFGAIFLVLFGGIGGGLIYLGWRGKKTIDTPEAEDKPWLARPEWNHGQIYSDAKTGMYGIWGFAAVWNLISAPAVIFGFPEVWRDEGAVALVILLFPAVGLGLIYWAIKSTLEWKRFGRTPLSMDPFPGSIGGDVGGEILVHMRYDSNVVYKLTLTCVHSRVTGSGKNRSRSETAKWQDEGYAKVKPAADGVRLQFRFSVPSGLPETEEHSNSYYFWRLSIEAELEGIDLDRSFEIPVYATTSQSQHIRLDSTTELPAGAPRITAESLLPMTQKGAVKELIYPMFRKPLRSLGISLFGAVFFGAGVFMWGQAAKEGMQLYFMSAIFSFVGGSILVWGLYTAINRLTVRFDGQSLHVERALLGFTTSTYDIAYYEIQEVKAKEGMKSNSGKKMSIEYSIVAKSGRKEIPLAEHLTSASEKNKIVEYFEEEFTKSDSKFEI